jgi:site-specific DNA-adenine methylase
LPFQGQKRFFVQRFKEALKNYPTDATYVDLFGGSGLLSHTVKSVYPAATVIYNDFDGFKARLALIPETNKILEELRGLELEATRGKKLTPSDHAKVSKILTAVDRCGFVDWISLSGSLKFSMNYGHKLEDFTKDTMYNTIRKSNFSDANDYLEGITVVKEDYKRLFEDYRENTNVVFLVDPPYLSTDTATYSREDYWKLRDYLDVLDLLHDHSYFYFTSSKSQIVELCEWVETRTSRNANPFRSANRETTNNRTSHNTGYTDIMYHIKRNKDE